MGKTFEHLTWDDLCNLMCGDHEDEIIRQTDNVRVTKRCKEPTYFYWNDNRRVVRETCEYLEDGKCILNVCVRKGERK